MDGRREQQGSYKNEGFHAAQPTQRLLPAYDCSRSV
jgi:hypothetical protein